MRTPTEGGVCQVGTNSGADPQAGIVELAKSEAGATSVVLRAVRRS